MDVVAGALAAHLIDPGVAEAALACLSNLAMDEPTAALVEAHVYLIVGAGIHYAERYICVWSHSPVAGWLHGN